MNDLTHIEVVLLHSADEKTVERINALTRQIHSKSRQVTVTGLVDHLHKSTIAVAVDHSDNDQIVGMGILAPCYCVTHVEGLIRNIVVSKGLEHIRSEIIELLVTRLTREAMSGHFDTLQAHVNSERSDLLTAFKKLGFTGRDYHTLRLHLPAARRRAAMT